jgi:hypothetical protein
VLAALGALFDKVEVLDHDSPGMMGFGHGEDLGDGRPQMAVPGGGTEPGQLQRDSYWRPQWVAVGVQGRHRQVPDVEVDRDDRAIAELVEGGHRLGVKGPGGVDVPAVAGRLIGDVVADSTVGGLGGHVTAPVGPAH